MASEQITYTIETSENERVVITAGEWYIYPMVRMLMAKLAEEVSFDAPEKVIHITCKREV